VQDELARRARPPLSQSMDDVTQLISELQCKLSELDSKVAAYRQEMRTEFQRYSDQLLQRVPENVSAAVVRVIAESLSKYPSLNPEHGDMSDSPSSPGATNAENMRMRHYGRKSPPPILFHTSGVPKESGQRSPHEREREFTGLFTPSYLPLLDSHDKPMSSPPAVASPRQIKFDITPRTTAEGTQTTPELLRDASPLMPPPPPIRRLTDSSSGSEPGNIRRSALRRSSTSSNKASPRRVRFDVGEGQAVSPTVSPQASQMALPQLGGDALPPHQPTAKTYESEHRLPVILPDLSDVEDEDPPPIRKKVSSTERLRALSKLPLEDPANWTAVNSEQELEENTESTETEQGAKILSISQRNISSVYSLQKPDHPKESTRENTPFPREDPGSPLEEFEEKGDDEEDSDEDYVSMRPSRRHPIPHSWSNKSTDVPNPRAQTEPIPMESPPNPKAGLAQIATEIKQNANGEVQGKIANGSVDGDLMVKSPKTVKEVEMGTDEDTAHHDVEEDIFGMEDDDAIGYPLTRVPKTTSEHSDTAESETEDADGQPEETVAKRDSVSVPSGRPIAPRSSHPISASVGSYRGRMITTFDVVKDPRIHDQAAELGDFNSMVGSLHDRTAVEVEGGNLNSLRAGSMDIASFSGTPRSLSERMAMEDAMALRRNNGGQRQETKKR